MPCQHPVHSVRTYRRTEYVEKATEGDRRWSDDTGDRIGTGIQQNQMLARRHHGIEKQLPVFTAQIALPHNGDHVTRCRRRRLHRFEGTPRRRVRSARPRDAGTERIGTIVHTVSSPVRKLARVGLPARLRESIARTSARRNTVSPPNSTAATSSRWAPALCQESAGAVSVSRSRARISTRSHSAGECGPARSRSETARRSTNSGETSSQVDVCAVHVIKW